MKTKLSIFWFRRDLRLADNTGLSMALNQEGYPVLPIFIFDPIILNQLENKADRRVDYIHQTLTQIDKELHDYQSGLQTFLNHPLEVFKTLTDTYDIQAVYCNRDYEPQAIKRDTLVYDYLKSLNIPLKAFKDQVIFDKNDVLKADGNPYTVFTPYANKWKTLITAKHFKEHTTENFKDHPTEKLTDLLKEHTLIDRNFLKVNCGQGVGDKTRQVITKGTSSYLSNIISLDELGFQTSGIKFQEPILDATIIDNYHQTRDFPAKKGTSQLGMALRFGTISIRKCVKFALNHNQTWLNELIWREFFMQILYHFPQVVTNSFKPKYDLIKWRNNEAEFEKWCQGKTGFPIVDAGMRELNQTGFMHNRVRMIVASFLCKHLLIDWRWGEAYFASKLNDYDLSANNGNWQWAAGSGCDATPYFRVFNPYTQTEKFDKHLSYTKKWVPELGTSIYPKPMVDHAFARTRALAIYGEALKDRRSFKG